MPGGWAGVEPDTEHTPEIDLEIRRTGFQPVFCKSTGWKPALRPNMTSLAIKTVRNHLPDRSLVHRLKREPTLLHHLP